jgi:pimeloyl-ACP methyl ester carboxylesterase
MPLTMPVLAIGGEKSFGANEAVVFRNVATNVQQGVIANCGHWLMEERPTETVTMIRTFLDAPAGNP